ncbi:hypothetical protein G6F63_016999 [Rhizopus arrhizus]|nr:hypothetical protein G6F23_015981 [Rhizopus arrhizus]KAG0742532.1 hypothetical protein G6F24_016464 [Rhizopus arrhizus]KAG1239928.1 hypothetical protein G6F68_018160 [Rhizopus microsporus]KAG1290799.1 hypothetical protein G6F63_016999 [Rhizopus arrhizus]
MTGQRGRCAAPSGAARKRRCAALQARPPPPADRRRRCSDSSPADAPGRWPGHAAPCDRCDRGAPPLR